MHNFPEIRRRDRILDEGRAIELLETAEYGFLALGEDTGGYGYGVPMSFAYDKEENMLYFHCAPEGQKIECLGRNPRVSFCVVGATRPQPEKFTTLYESVIAFGTAEICATDDERRQAVRMLTAKYCPGLEAQGDSYMERSLHRTAAFRIRVEHIAAKCKR